MSQTFTCGDHEALVAYLYDECDRSERPIIDAHIVVCSACAEEVASLGDTRYALATWSPPETQLGFRVVSEVPSATATVLRPSRWWHQPLPGWAQAAAALVIFATGATLGAIRGTSVPMTPVTQVARTASSTQAAPASQAVASSQAAAVTATDLADLERRLRSEMSQVHPAASASAKVDDEGILQRVRVLIEDSEQRQQRELALRTAEVVRDFDAQRRVDLTKIERTLGQMDGTTGVEVEQQRQMLNYLMRVSQSGQ